MDGSCVVSFGGTYGGDYFIPCSSVSDFDELLVFNGSDPIYIYSDVNHQGNRLICQPGCTPAYVNSSDQYVYLQPSDVTWNTRALWYREYDIVIAFCLISLVVLRFLTIFRR